MTAQEIHDKIVIVEYPYNADTNQRIVTGTLSIERHMAITQTLLRSAINPKQLLEHVRDTLHIDLMRTLYDDQRQLLYDATLKLCAAAGSYQPDELSKARNDLLFAATYQQPK